MNRKAKLTAAGLANSLDRTPMRSTLARNDLKWVKSAAARIDDVTGKIDQKASLVNGKVPSSELPSYVDDVIEVANYAALPATGERGKIYVTLDTGKVYRWGGTTYVEIGNPDLSGYKTKQSAVSDPTASGTAASFIDAISQDANGVITPTKKTIVAAGVGTAGIVAFSSADPQMDGTASPGSAATAARSDHVHPGETEIGEYSLPASAFPITYTAGGTTHVIFSLAGGNSYRITPNSALGSLELYDTQVNKLVCTFDRSGVFSHVGDGISNLNFATSPNPVVLSSVFVRGVKVAKSSDKANLVNGTVPASELPNGTTTAKGIVQLDTSLATNGRAADAKATGNALDIIAPYWASNRSYVQYDVVKTNGTYYYAKSATSGTTPPSSDTAHWGPLANLAALAHLFLPLTDGTTRLSVSQAGGSATITIPSATTRTGDCVVDVENTGSSGPLVLTVDGYPGSFKVAVASGTSVDDMLSVPAEGLARLVFSPSGFSPGPAFVLTRLDLEREVPPGPVYTLNSDGTVSTDGVLDADGTLSVDGTLNSDGTLSVDAS